MQLPQGTVLLVELLVVRCLGYVRYLAGTAYDAFISAKMVTNHTYSNIDATNQFTNRKESLTNKYQAFDSNQAHSLHPTMRSNPKESENSLRAYLTNEPPILSLFLSLRLDYGWITVGGLLARASYTEIISRRFIRRKRYLHSLIMDRSHADKIEQWGVDLATEVARS